MLAAAERNYGGYHLKTVGLRLQIVTLIVGSSGIVAALGYLR